MTDAAADLAPAARRPLFYERPEVLQLDRHGRAGLRPLDGHGFAAKANAIPLNVSEFAKAAVSYPIVFAGREALTPVAVVGLRAGENLCVEADGRWRADAHVPAYVRRHPFILTRPDPQSDDVMLCLDTASGRMAEDAAAEGAAPLFVDGEASEHARRALDFCLEFQRHALATEEIVRQLRTAGVLAPQEGKVELADGEVLRLTDFHVVDEKALNALPEEAFLALRRTGALAAAYCQMVSMNAWSRLSGLALARKVRATA